MFTKLKKSKLEQPKSNEDSSLNKEVVFIENRSTNSSFNANKSKDLINNINKSNDSEQNLIDQDTNFEENYLDHLPHNQALNSLDFLEQIHHNSTVNDTDDDSVQILDECDEKESVRVIGCNSDSDLISVKDESMFPNEEEEEEAESNPEDDNASVIELSSRSSRESFNTHFSTNNDDALSLFANLSPDHSHLPSVGRLFGESVVSCHIENESFDTDFNSNSEDQLSLRQSITRLFSNIDSITQSRCTITRFSYG